MGEIRAAEGRSAEIGEVPVGADRVVTSGRTVGSSGRGIGAAIRERVGDAVGLVQDLLMIKPRGKSYDADPTFSSEWKNLYDGNLPEGWKQAIQGAKEAAAQADHDGRAAYQPTGEVIELSESFDRAKEHAHYLTQLVEQAFMQANSPKASPDTPLVVPEAVYPIHDEVNNRDVQLHALKFVLAHDDVTGRSALVPLALTGMPEGRYARARDAVLAEANKTFEFHGLGKIELPQSKNPSVPKTPAAA